MTKRELELENEALRECLAEIQALMESVLDVPAEDDGDSDSED